MSRVSDRFLLAWLAATLVVPGLIFLPGGRDGQLLFVLYGEPKRAAVLVLVWWFLALFVLLARHRLDDLELPSVLRKPQVLLLGTLLSLFGLSILWAEVPENAAYELALYLPLFVLTVLLAGWMRIDGRAKSVVEGSLIGLAALATVVGGLQLVRDLPFLTPINPLGEVAHPSVMGYKNPMALALAGQLFLLFGWIVSARSVGFRLVLIACALAELAYLVSLESRTSLAAVSAGGIAVFLAASLWPSEGLPPRRLGAILGLCVVVIGLGIVAFPGARAKAESLVSYATRPAAYWQSDRGVYLANTVNMARHRPWGAGLGDWQTQYPVYRLHDRYRAFDRTHEVRRAHSDHVQILGESGWLGLALWVAFLASLILGALRSYRASRRPAELFLFAQLVCWTAAMATDYVLDLPFHRLAFFALCALAISWTPPSGSSLRIPRRAWLVAGAAMTAAALLASILAVRTIRQEQGTALMTRLYLEALESDGARRTGLLRDAAELGEEHLLAGGAHGKTRYKDWQVLADVLSRLGAADAARHCAFEALRLHPHSPATLRLLARLHAGEERERWQARHDFVMDLATAGYLDPRPGP